MTVMQKTEKGLNLLSKLQNTIVGYIRPGTIRGYSVCNPISKRNIDFLLGAVSGLLDPTTHYCRSAIFLKNAFIFQGFFLSLFNIYAYRLCMLKIP